MKFHLIDIDTWNRKPYYTHFLNETRCTFSLTANIDITVLLDNLRDKNKKLYPALIHMTAKIVNAYPDFRISYDEDGELGYWESMNPSFTIFHPEDNTFSSLWTPYTEEFHAFHESYLADVGQYGKGKGLIGKKDQPANTFPISCIPWVSFTGFNLNVFNEGMYLLPIITFGKYFEQTGRVLLPVSLQLHHAVCDGYHAGLFVGELQRFADHCKEWIDNPK